MALDKKQINLNLVKGTDTKTNPQIDDGFQDLENVIFSKELTVKKRPGLSLLKPVPSIANGGYAPSENYSLLAKSGKDIVALSENGLYKKIDSESSFVYIDGISNLSLEETIFPSDLFAISSTYKFFVKKSTDSINYYYDFYFYQLNDIFYTKSRVFSGINEFSAHKIVVSPSGEFYFFGIGGSGSNKAAIYHNGALVYTSPTITNLDGLTLVDGYADSTRVFFMLSYDGAVKNIMFVLTIASVVTVEYNLGATLNSSSNIMIDEKSSTHLWLTTAKQVGNFLNVYQFDFVKATGAISSGPNLLYSIPKHDITLSYNPRIVAVSYSATEAMFIVFEQMEVIPRTFASVGHVRSGSFGTNIVKIVGIQGKGKPFLFTGGSWHVPVMLSVGDRQISVLLREGYSLANQVFPCMVALNGQLSSAQLSNPGLFNCYFNQSYAVDNTFYFASSSVNESCLFNVSVIPDYKNGAIEVGENLITFGSLMGYFDGVDFSEMGFIGNPYLGNISGVVGTMAADTYQFVAIYTWIDSKNNLFRSAESNTLTYIAGVGVQFNLTINHSIITTKEEVTVEVYVRKSNRVFQLYTSYKISNTSTNFYKQDINISSYPEADAIFLYTDPTTRENTTPLNARCMALFADRLFYVSNDDTDQVRFTKQKKDWIGFEFVEDFRQVILDKRISSNDKITALFGMDGRLLIFKENSILFISGEGPADDGSQNDFSNPALISSNVGCISQRSVVLSPDGVMFMSSKGIYIVKRDLSVDYIGSSVERFNYLTITSSLMLEDANEIRFTSLEGIILVYNYYNNAWSWFTGLPTKSSCIFNGKHHSLVSDNVIYDDSTTFKNQGAFVTQKVSSPWVRLSEIQGYQRAYKVLIIGEYKTPHQMNVNVYYDYEEFVSETYLINPLAESQYNIVTRPSDADLQSGAKTNGIYQLEIDLIRKTCSAIRIEITDIGQSILTNTGECFSLSNLTFTVGVKSGTKKLPASKKY